jgi:nucleoid-associated protein YgaU
MFDRTLDTEQAFDHHRLMSRTYVRRRVIAMVVALGVGVLVGAPVAGALGIGGQDHIRPVARLQVVVREGDTAWAIAGRVAPQEDPRRVVAAISEANGLDAGSLVPGQVLVVPVGSTG